MAIKISLESTIIPVEIGDLKFEIDVTDEKYEAFTNNFNVFLKEIVTLDEESSEDIEKLKVLVQKLYDELLGDGSYEQIYTKMPNISFVAGTLANIVTQLAKEMEKRIIPTTPAKVVKKKQTNKK